MNCKLTCPFHNRPPNLLTCFIVSLFGLSNTANAQSFVDVTADAGIALTHQSSQSLTAIEDHPDNTIRPLLDVDNRAQLQSSWLTGGVATGDYDNDGWQDIFIVGGDLGQSKLFRNMGNGQFTDVSNSVGLAVLAGRIAGAVFADYDGDGDLDLLLGGALGQLPHLLNNSTNQGQGFMDVFATAFPDFDVNFAPNTWGASFGDFNNDGCLDVFLPHSLSPQGPLPRLSTATGSGQHLWKNDCNGHFTDVSLSAQISTVYDDLAYNISLRDQTFAANFTDLNHDGYADLLVAADIRSSLVFINNQDNTFQNLTDRKVIDDRDAMGSAVGDLNGDGHIDWFTANIGMPNVGNKLYSGVGDGTFINSTAGSGLIEGHWGWSSCMADFNADRWPDLFHVTGFYYPNNSNPDAATGRFNQTPAVLFISNGDGTFTESAAAYGLNDIGEGRGVSCFDYDNDGDIDVAISNYKGDFKLYSNQLAAQQRNYINIRLRNSGANVFAVGARILVSSEHNNDEGTLVQEIYAGGNFNSSNPALAYFGLGDWQGPLTITVQSANNPDRVFPAVAKNQYLTLDLRDDVISSQGFESINSPVPKL